MISVGSLPLCGWPLLQQHESRCMRITAKHKYTHSCTSYDFHYSHIRMWEGFRNFAMIVKLKSRLPHDNSSFQASFCCTLWPTCDIQFKRIERKVFMFQWHEKRTQWTGWWNNYSNEYTSSSVSSHPENNTSLNEATLTTTTILKRYRVRTSTLRPRYNHISWRIRYIWEGGPAVNNTTTFVYWMICIRLIKQNYMFRL